MEATDLARATAEIASHDVGVMEVPLGSNRGARVDEYQAYTGLPLGSAYCSSACSLWIHEAAQALGVTPEFKKSGSALGVVRNNPDLFFTELTSADIPCLGINQDADGQHGHCFLIVGLDEATGHLQTVDPNSNNGGSREGVGVFLLNRRTVSDPERKGYVRIA